MKYERHSKIIEVIKKYPIETQEELAEVLRNEGFEVTQATVSRDIKELRLIKVLGRDGRYKYASNSNSDTNYIDKHKNIFKQSVINIDYAMNIVVVKTLPGMANGAAEVIDTLDFSEIVGSIAGDNTIMVITKSEKKAQELIIKFKKIL